MEINLNEFLNDQSREHDLPSLLAAYQATRPTIVPAAPGTYMLTWTFIDDSGRLGLSRLAVIAWMHFHDGRDPLPLRLDEYSHERLSGGFGYDLPDGSTVDIDGRGIDGSRDEFIAEMLDSALTQRGLNS